ncbi:hypothetical protein M1L60_19000 [Actinoplanes sp. TRM 88003]|uniref:Uncharacterized protein n=1 Tax=Paractinoplanes aksuensis TaxID=2939490 RepID=A0ABT1DPG4_9ACTN|nr:hypothetical protein [Actinoplanes aksuensis]MCO8272685.1 hypothetical protein [Actinoplanes aksuensis]
MESNKGRKLKQDGRNNGIRRQPGAVLVFQNAIVARILLIAQEAVRHT